MTNATPDSDDPIALDRLTTLKDAISRLRHTQNNAAKAFETGLLNIAQTWEFSFKGRPERAMAEKKEFQDRFDALGREFEDLHGRLAGLIDSAAEVATLRAENQRLTAQLVEVADFRARVREFLQVE